MIRVQEADFDVGAELARLSEGRRDIGGLACFIGLVRDRVGDSVTAMTLEHYPGMTEKRLAEIEVVVGPQAQLRGSGRVDPGGPGRGLERIRVDRAELERGDLRRAGGQSG